MFWPPLSHIEHKATLTVQVPERVKGTIPTIDSTDLEHLR